MPVGAIVAWPHGVTYPTGWVLCDGVANASGSALDHRGRFLVGWDGSHASAGGSASHTHAGHDNVAHAGGAVVNASLSGGTRKGGTTNPASIIENTNTHGHAFTQPSDHALSAHDGPNSEPPYSPIDWIERLT